MKQNAIEKYLTNYSEPETQQLVNISLPKTFTYSIVIPAYQEASDFILQFIETDFSDQNILVIVVINQPETDDDIQPQQTLTEELYGLGNVMRLSKSITFVELATQNNNSNGLLIIDRYTNPTPVKQGVGLARKIGCDIACYFINQGTVQSQYIASTDADALLPADYFLMQAKLEQRYSVGCFNFTHHCENKEIHQATQQYETALRYYVAGLHYANSPFAFFTIGSILLFDAQAYANVRGFPKKSAGEDFYLLNKLAKIGEVAFFKESQITLTARLSARVPFGTGPAVQKIMVLTQQNEPYCYYHPELFSLLKLLNHHSTELYAYVNELNLWLSKMPNIIGEALTTIGFHQFINKHLTDKPVQFNKQWLVWFDAFKTLKFLHALRELQFSDIPLEQALQLKKFDI